MREIPEIAEITHFQNEKLIRLPGPTLLALGAEEVAGAQVGPAQLLVEELAHGALPGAGPAVHEDHVRLGLCFFL